MQTANRLSEEAGTEEWIFLESQSTTTWVQNIASEKKEKSILAPGKTNYAFKIRARYEQST